MKHYFKGYYFKCCGGGRAAALIPALHIDGKKRSASLQVVTDNGAFVIPYSDIRFGRKPPEITIGKNRFSSRGIILDACSGDCRIYGKLRFGRLQKIKYDIMGPFRFVPWMQCRHEVISMSHFVEGRMNINGIAYRFDGGRGYIEGDSGRSFPGEYVWTQCHFAQGSLMLAVADVPLPGTRFRGVIAAIAVNGREYRLATYLGARVAAAGDNAVTVKQGSYTLYAKLLQARHQTLNAPVNGKMARRIRESVSCRAFYRFTHKDKVLLEFESGDASFEYELK